jgi:hypothetical protein
MDILGREGVTGDAYGWPAMLGGWAFAARLTAAARCRWTVEWARTRTP